MPDINDNYTLLCQNYRHVYYIHIYKDYIKVTFIQYFGFYKFHVWVPSCISLKNSVYIFEDGYVLRVLYFPNNKETMAIFNQLGESGSV